MQTEGVPSKKGVSFKLCQRQPSPPSLFYLFHCCPFRKPLHYSEVHHAVTVHSICFSTKVQFRFCPTRAR
ncbi:hypothetical protein EMCRGX_G009922 [Ephydatia muelleri]